MTHPSKPRELPGRRTANARRDATSTGDAFGAAPNWAGDARLRDLRLEAIRPNHDQPRKRFDENALRALAASIRERGLLQPVLVRPLEDGESYALVAGERRWRAAHLAGLARLPAFVRNGADDASALELALIENAAREDLTPVEEARTLSTLIDDLGVTQAALARRICRSRSDLANTLRLLDLSEDVLDLLDSGQLSKGHGKSLLRESNVDRRRKLAQTAVNEGWSVRQLERAIAAPIHAPKRSTPIDEQHGTVAESLAARLRPGLGEGVSVRPRGEGFAIEILAADLDAAESLVARLITASATDQPGAVGA
jgi:ParB family transcriptional regulator, chromosome partitioning protein